MVAVAATQISLSVSSFARNETSAIDASSYGLVTRESGMDEKADTSPEIWESESSSCSSESRILVRPGVKPCGLPAASSTATASSFAGFAKIRSVSLIVLKTLSRGHGLFSTSPSGLSTMKSGGSKWGRLDAGWEVKTDSELKLLTSEEGDSLGISVSLWQLDIYSKGNGWYLLFHCILEGYVWLNVCDVWIHTG